MPGLRDKAVLVCGGASGIGAATVRRLCEEGLASRSVISTGIVPWRRPKSAALRACPVAAP